MFPVHYQSLNGVKWEHIYLKKIVISKSSATFKHFPIFLVYDSHQYNTIPTPHICFEYITFAFDWKPVFLMLLLVRRLESFHVALFGVITIVRLLDSSRLYRFESYWTFFLATL